MRSRLSFATLLIGLLALICIDYGGLHFSKPLDLAAGDWFLRQLAPERSASSDIVIVDIDQKSLEDMNEVAGKWPWPRSIHAELIDYIARQKPQAIVFDILFNEPDVFNAESDQLFQSTAQAHGNLYFAHTMLNDGNSTLLASLPPSVGLIRGRDAQANASAVLMLPSVLPRDSWRGGLINFSEDDDGIGRHYLLYREEQGWQIPSLPWRLALDFNWPHPNDNAIRLNWQPAHQHIAYADLYLDANREITARPQQELRNKIVIIGTAAPGLQDLRPTPINQQYPGVEILATAIDNLKNNDWLRDAPRLPFAALALAICSFLFWGFQRQWHTLKLTSLLVVISFAALALMYLALQRNWFLPLAAPLLWAWIYFWLAALMAYLAEKASREHAIAMFSRFLDPRVVGDLVGKGKIDLNQKAQTRELTVLFSDIRGFTTLSESHSPEYIVALLNRYFSLQVAIIFKHGGTLDKFIGDAIMAFWGAPADDPHHAEHAIAAALEMAQALAKFKAELGDTGTDFDVGIGIHTGPAVVGFIGSESRLDYTVIGDTVNLASRIEGLTKGVARILVSQDCVNACAASKAKKLPYEFIDHGNFAVKGREQTVQLFEPQVKS